LVSAAKDGVMQIRQFNGALSPLSRQSIPATIIAVDPTGEWLATNVGGVRLWRLADAQCVWTAFPTTLLHENRSLAFLANGQWLAAGFGNHDGTEEVGQVLVWRLSDGKPMLTHTEPKGVLALAGAAAHKFLAWSNSTRRVTLRDLTRPDPHVFPALKKPATTLAMSPDARWLAAGDDWSIRVWDIARRDDKANLIGHKGRVLSLAFTPDGRYLLSGSGDQKIITWDVATGQQEHVVDWELGRVTSVAVSPDGLLCAAGGDRGRIVVWDRDEA
jgi:WD40 repeat protein